MMAQSQPWTKLSMGYQECLKILKNDKLEFYGAFYGEKLVGFILIDMNGALRGYIKILCVDAKNRGAGVGEKLLKFAEKRVFSIYPNVFLCVSSFNRKAQKFYKKAGYKKVGILKDFLIKGADEYIFRKTKGPIMSAKYQKNS
ncbi:MAG: hypothetical protein Fur0012_07610 [Elusimicrobiota bacterium]